MQKWKIYLFFAAVTSCFLFACSILEHKCIASAFTQLLCWSMQVFAHCAGSYLHFIGAIYIYIFFYNMQVYTCTIHPMHFKQTQTCTLSFLCSLSLSCRRLMIPLHQSIFWPPVALQAWPSVSSLFMDERKMVPLGPRCTEVCKKVIEHIYSLRNIPPPRRRFYRKIFAKQANYLPAILLLKMNMPPSVCTNLCLCVRTCMPMYMSWRECVYYLSMRLL